VAASLVCERLDGGSLTAIDRSEKMIALATRRNQEHVAARRARFTAIALEDADFGERRFDKVFGVHVAALWRSGEALAVVRAHLAPGGTLSIVTQEPGWGTPADARPFAAEVAASLRALGFMVDGPRFADVGPLVCVVCR
jgi:SAM-dependent methyltransferase